MSHPRHDLEPLFQNPTRFSILALLAPADKVEFRFVRETVEISDSALSQHVTTLEGAGYVSVDKGRVGRRARTWLSATDTGRSALTHHLETLDRIAAATESDPEDRRSG